METHIYKFSYLNLEAAEAAGGTVEGIDCVKNSFTELKNISL